jgi:uncharacterized protein
VIGSVDTSEFMVSVAASVGFLLALGQEGVNFAITGALLAGGLVAAPVAAWVVRHFPQRLLGASVGGLLIVTNLRSLFNSYEVALDIRTTAYLVAAAAWIAALAVSYAKYRGDQQVVVEDS